jgi:hypothetical protein
MCVDIHARTCRELGVTEEWGFKHGQKNVRVGQEMDGVVNMVRGHRTLFIPVLSCMCMCMCMCMCTCMHSVDVDVSVDADRQTDRLSGR